MHTSDNPKKYTADDYLFKTDRETLCIDEMIILKKMVDAKLQGWVYQHVEFKTLELYKPKTAFLNTLDEIQRKKIGDGIAVTVEQDTKNGVVLVKVGPKDLSGVKGHGVREQIIREVVNRGLKDKKIRDANGMPLTFNDVNVSACIGVRGRLEMAKAKTASLLGKKAEVELLRNTAGKHVNAYIKTVGETKLTHWEPRMGPQPFLNNGICAICISAATSLFEQAVRETRIRNSTDATEFILKNPLFKKTLDVVRSTQSKKSFLKKIELFVDRVSYFFNHVLKKTLESIGLSHEQTLPMRRNTDVKTKATTLLNNVHTTFLDLKNKKKTIKNHHERNRTVVVKITK